MNAIYDLANEVQVYGGLSAEYIEKMMHLIPEVPVIGRETFLLERAKGKNVLDVGCTGKLSEAIRKTARIYYGVDREKPEWLPNAAFFEVDLDYTDYLPGYYGLKGDEWVNGYNLIIASEIIEHLSNAGNFLDILRERYCPIILTTPNAHSEAGYNYINRGIECVNGEHVAHYSWWTLKTLVERHGFTITEWYWYNGKPGTAEGLIFCLE